MTLIHYIFPVWRTAVFVHTLCGTVPLFLLLWFVVPESAVWLKDSGRMDRLKQVEQWTSKVNGTKYGTVYQLQIGHLFRM
jgi:hypothetical protein